MNKCDACKYAEWDWSELKMIEICTDCTLGFRNKFESEDDCGRFSAKMESEVEKGSIAPLLDVRPTINAIPIPDNATNGYVLKAVFPDITFTPNDTSLMDDMFEGGFEPDSIYTDLDNGFWLTKKWWDAPYKKGE